MIRQAACLLLHGFGGEPFEVLPLARALASRGAPVLAPLLPGHGETTDSFAKTRWDDWLRAATAAYDSLAASHGRVAVLGVSMGGSLALRLAQTRSPAALAVISAPVFLYRFIPLELPDWRMVFLPLLRKARPMWPTSPGRPESREIAPWKGYESVVPLEPLHSFHKALGTVRGELGSIHAPLLAMHARRDRSVSCSNAWEIARGVSSRERRVVLFDIEERVTRHHLLTTHRETRERVADLCVDFIETMAGAGDDVP